MSITMEQTWEENLHATEDRVQSAVCPIYGLDHRDRPHIIGSAIPLRIGSNGFFVTATHVLDENKHTTLYTAGRERLIELTGPSFRDRKFDFSFMPLAVEITDELTPFTFLTPENMDADDLPAAQTLYGFVGYPETKNKPLFPERKFRITSTLFALSPSLPERYAALGLEQQLHFAGEFNRKRLVDRHKNMVTGPMPHGMSGGGVWRLGRYKEFLTSSDPEKLIGIGIEYREPENVLIGVRISLVIASLASCYPEVAAALPQATWLRVRVATQ